jgi:hypothetical protein
MTYTINRDKFKTEIGKQTYDRLLKISKDTEFLLAVLIDIQGDERKQDLLNWLDNNLNATDDDVLDYLDEKYN